MRLFESKDLIQHVSRFNDEYFCTIIKVEFVSGLIRVHIDERGDMSLGELQHPNSSTLGIYDDGVLKDAVQPKNSHFTVSDRQSNYVGYLDFDLGTCDIPEGSIIAFQYGEYGYEVIKLFPFDFTMAKKEKKP